MTDTESLRTPPALDAGEQARADIYTLLGALLARPPDAALLDILQGIDPDTTGVTAMTTVWQGLRSAAGSIEPEGVKQEYFALFIGLGRGELVPYASFYIHGLLMEKVLASLREELAALGFERQENVAEPEDHVAALCETMGMIISGSCLSLKEQAAFFRMYIAPWMGAFFTDLTQAETAHFYKAVGQLGRQFLEIETQYFSMPA
jgi:TorA maturation chaperone TorD